MLFLPFHSPAALQTVTTCPPAGASVVVGVDGVVVVVDGGVVDGVVMVVDGVVVDGVVVVVDGVVVVVDGVTVVSDGVVVRGLLEAVVLVASASSGLSSDPVSLADILMSAQP